MIVHMGLRLMISTNKCSLNEVMWCQDPGAVTSRAACHDIYICNKTREIMLVSAHCGLAISRDGAPAGAGALKVRNN